MKSHEISDFKVVSINPGVIETNIQTVTRSKISLLGNSRFANAYRKYLDNVPKWLATKRDC